VLPFLAEHLDEKLGSAVGHHVLKLVRTSPHARS